MSAQPDLYDENSLRDSEREMIWMFLHDLNERVLALEEVADHAHPRGQGLLW